jgi:AcrR family transcriptional regulator
MELYLERGFEQTTVADIAERAGLTARTFFRYFADKPEVLFGGAAELEKAMVAAVATAPADAGALTAVAAALDAAADMIGGRRDYSQQRYAVINANVDLRERELTKMASLSTALADALRSRGVSESQAALAAETGVGVFRVGFERWVGAPTDRGLATVLHESMNELRTLL